MRVSIFIVVLALILTLSAAAQTQTSNVQTWNIDPPHTAAQFSVRHLGISTVRGSFTKVSGSVQYDPANPSKTTIDATIDAASVDTRVEKRDNDLRSPNFFDAAKYPTLTFKSKRVDVAGTGKLKVTGDLTMHGVTKEVTLDVDGPSAALKDPHGNQHMGASATTTINRKDFGVNGARTAVGDDVSITIDMELVQPAPAP
jgi:polyisoprenoid-binding protein YceI